jgi:hypothetical protein
VSADAPHMRHLLLSSRKRASSRSRFALAIIVLMFAYRCARTAQAAAKRSVWVRGVPGPLGTGQAISNSQPCPRK